MYSHLVGVYQDTNHVRTSDVPGRQSGPKTIGGHVFRVQFQPWGMHVNCVLNLTLVGAR